MEFLSSALETSSRSSVPDILYCISRHLPSHLSSSTEQQRQERLNTVVTLVLGCVEECNYRKSVTQLAIEMVLSPAILADTALCRGADNPVRRFFHRLVEFGTVKRAYILLNATARLTSIWRAKPAAGALAGEFVEELAQLLVLRELEEDVYQQANDNERDQEMNAGKEETEARPEEGQSALLRILVLGCLCDLFRHPDDGRNAKQAKFLMSLLTRLFEVAAAVDLRRAQILTSPDYSCKLRAWQAICVLVPFVNVENVPLIQESVYAAMRVVAVPSVRYYQDTVLAYLCQKFPDVTIPFLVMALTDLHVPPLTSGALIFAAGSACLTKDTAFPGGELPQAYVGPLLQALLPWLSGQHAITRIVAQLLSFYLLSRLPTGDLESVEGNMDGDGCVSSAISASSIDATYLGQTLRFLQNHREIASLRHKAMLRFQETSVPACCTVTHLLAQHSTEQGGALPDLVPEHVEEALREAMTSLYRDLEAEHHMTYTSMAPVIRGENLFELKQDASSPRALLVQGNADAEAAETFSLQKKIVVSDVLAALLPPPPVDKSRNTRGIQLQELVVCASLLERVPNVAGLARTCEIFAASKLLIPDLRMLKDPLFDQISSSAGKWIQMEEVHEGHTRASLRRYKQEGYTVVGLEQTDDSSCLSTVALPRKMLLLLGREKEGIPVPLLQELDLVVQIPQLGLVRSLNVHVSASLIVWEYYKQHSGRRGEGHV
jgi:tRNA G18 (ribose-2'-O)-methylase SpoU